MKHTVKLRFFRDEANGEYGLAHESTYNDNNAFNAFWNGIGIFHDVFEHWFENEHKYFMGDAAMNVGGEMAAMGAYLYFVDEMGLKKRHTRESYLSNGELMRGGTESELIESIAYGYTNYGSTLECAVPKQKPCDNSELEYQCEKMYKNAMERELPETDTDEYNAAKEYKESVTLAKIKNLHRFGYRMAEKMFPDSWENRSTLNEFIEYWNEFTKHNSAEELMNYFEGVEVTVRKKAGLLSWKAVLISSDNDIKDVTLKPTYCPHNLIEDTLIENYVFED